MPRIKFKKGFQSKFLFEAQKLLECSWIDLAKKLEISHRTLFDWRREKYNLSEQSFKQINDLVGSQVNLANNYTVLPDYWSIEKAARKGGIAVSKKYGGPGTPQGRIKGGKNSQLKRKQFPELYQHCNLRKIVVKPENSTELAEFIGIVLGDGSILNDSQVNITLERYKEEKFFRFVVRMIKRLFNIEPHVHYYCSSHKKKIVCIRASGANLVDFLIEKGLRKGNKVTHQIDVPTWIKENISFSRSCLRGLVDTDGGIYYHRHRTQKWNCFNIGLTFTNKSVPLVKFVVETLQKLKFNPKVNYRGDNVYLYREPEVLKYLEEVGFSNVYHAERIKKYLVLKKRKGA